MQHNPRLAQLINDTTRYFWNNELPDYLNMVFDKQNSKWIVVSKELTDQYVQPSNETSVLNAGEGNVVLCKSIPTAQTIGTQPAAPGKAPGKAPGAPSKPGSAQKASGKPLAPGFNPFSSGK